MKIIQRLIPMRYARTYQGWMNQRAAEKRWKQARKQRQENH